MKKLIKTLLTVASFATVMGFASCNNPNDNVAQRGITITGVQVRPCDSTNVTETLSSVAAETFETVDMQAFVFAGVGLNNWGDWNGWNGWTPDTAFSGICLDGVIKAIPGKDIPSEKYTYVYNDLELVGASVADINSGIADWNNNNSSIKDSGENFKIENPKDGKTYYIDIVVNSDGTAEATLVEGTLGPNIVKVTVKNLSGVYAAGSTVTVASNISWGGVKKGAWSLTEDSFVNSSLVAAPVTDDSVTFYVTGNYNIANTWVDEQKVGDSNFKLEITNAAGDKLSGKQDAWYKLDLTSSSTEIDIVNDIITE